MLLLWWLWKVLMYALQKSTLKLNIEFFHVNMWFGMYVVVLQYWAYVYVAFITLLALPAIFRVVFLLLCFVVEVVFSPPWYAIQYNNYCSGFLDIYWAAS